MPARFNQVRAMRLLSTNASKASHHEQRLHRVHLHNDDECAKYFASYCQGQLTKNGDGNTNSNKVSPLAKKHQNGIIASFMNEVQQIKSTYPGVFGTKSYLEFLRYLSRINTQVIQSAWDSMIADGITPTKQHFKQKAYTYRRGLEKYLIVWKESLDGGFLCLSICLDGIRLLLKNDMFSHARQICELLDTGKHFPGEDTRLLSEMKMLTSDSTKEAENVLRSQSFITERQLSSYLSVCTRVKDPEAAEKFIAKKCAIMNPINKLHRTTLMAMHAASGNIKQSESHFRRILNPDQRTHSCLMRCYSLCGDIDSARRCFLSLCCFYVSVEFATYVDATWVAATHNDATFYDEIMNHASQYHTTAFTESLAYIGAPRPGSETLKESSNVSCYYLYRFIVIVIIIFFFFFICIKKTGFPSSLPSLSNKCSVLNH